VNYTRPALPCTVTMTRVAPSEGLDDDNLRSALKAVRDQIAAWLGVDDRDPLVRWAYDQKRGAARDYAVEVAFHV
jgi:fatty acid-binding protein DegV